jgi:hypothetical protein
MGRPRGMDFIRRGEDNVFMDVSYVNPHDSLSLSLLAVRRNLCSSVFALG